MTGQSGGSPGPAICPFSRARPCACGHAAWPGTTTPPSPGVYLTLVVAAAAATAVSAARSTRAALAEHE